MARGRFLIDIDCVEPIPCNPCETACPYGAITVGADITALPVADPEKCRGCARCLAVCPGLAIRLVEREHRGDRAVVAFPYEYEPVPRTGDPVVLTDRWGMPLGPGTVWRVQQPLREDPTRVVYVETSPEISWQARSIGRSQPATESGEGVVCRCEEVTRESIGRSQPATESGEGVVCRCEEVTRERIGEALANGETTLGGIKRRTRAGMGLCQGKTCERLILGMLSEAQGVPVRDLAPGSRRPPVVPLSLGEMASAAETDPLRELEDLWELSGEEPGGEDRKG